MLESEAHIDRIDDPTKESFENDINYEDLKREYPLRWPTEASEEAYAKFIGPTEESQLDKLMHMSLNEKDSAQVMMDKIVKDADKQAKKAAKEEKAIAKVKVIGKLTRVSRAEKRKQQADEEAKKIAQFDADNNVVMGEEENRSQGKFYIMHSYT